MKEILVINVNITGNSPQPIRIRELISHWQQRSKITLITMNNFADHELQLDSTIRVVKAEYSPIGRIMISKNIIASKEYLEAKKTTRRKIREFVRKIWRASIFYRLMFPDKFIFEHHKIIGAARKLKASGQNFDIVIISAAPFSLMKLGRVMKKLFPGASCIYDTGDPFYGNSSLDLIKPLRSSFAKWFEGKYLKDFDLIVVPTSVLKDHYITHFGNSIDTSRIRVIEQGFESMFSGVAPKTGKNRKSLKLLYAGGLYRGLREPFELYQAVRDYKTAILNLRIFGNIYKDLLPEPNSTFYYGGSITSDLLVQEYEECDATIFIDNSHGIQVPGKIFELLSIKRPILFIYDNPDSPTLSMFKDYKGVVMCKNNSVAIINSLDLIIENYNSFSYDIDLGQYTWPALAEKYLTGYL